MLRKASILFAVLFLAGVSPSYAQRQAATGAVQVRIVRVGFIVGGGGGEGNLTYRGKVYPFSVGGISVGTIGATSADLVGRAYNLRSPSDIAGTLYIGRWRRGPRRRSPIGPASKFERSHIGTARGTGRC